MTPAVGGPPGPPGPFGARALLTDVAALTARWLEAWPRALAAWSKFTRLRPPRLCRTEKEAAGEGLTASFAMIRLHDQAVIVSLPAIVDDGLEDLAVEILAHEVGHHVLAPATLTDHVRMIARMRWSLPTRERDAAMIANLYSDLLINDRLQRQAGLRIGEVFRRLGARPSPGPASKLWTVYLRIYELLWSLPRGALGGARTDDAQEGDAWLGARLVRSYARDWLPGSGRFAALMLPYLLADGEALGPIPALLDTRAAAAGGEPIGVADVDPDEQAGAIHPALDPALAGLGDLLDENGDAHAPPPAETERNQAGGGQTREPFQYGEILRAAGLVLDDHELAVRYYAERARPHLVPFPRRRVPRSPEPLLEGLEPWSLGDPLDELAWFETVIASPRVVPGLTTVRRVVGESEGREVELAPVDLDLYVDSSGSMPDPKRNVSYPGLAGAIIALSALRVGARVQATLWSGAREFISTPGFVRDERAILRVLTGYFGGGTAFPIHVLRDTFADRRPGARPAHVLVVSDDGVSTMFDQDERGNSGWDVCRAALAAAGGGGSLVLNLFARWEEAVQGDNAYARIVRARDREGWAVYPVSTMEELVSFARAFARRRYGDGDGDVGGARRGGGGSIGRGGRS